MTLSTIFFSIPGKHYPPFACGSGHIITAELALDIAEQASHLRNLQGEDVSLGVWLMSTSPNYLKVCCCVNVSSFNNAPILPLLLQPGHTLAMFW